MDKDQQIQQKDQQIAQLEAALQQAVQTIEQLQQRIQELEQRLAKDSHNSHLPPSSDRFVRQPKSLRPKSEKPSGGQKGHPGKHLMMSATPDHIIVHPPDLCWDCQQDLTTQPILAITRRQVIDLPTSAVQIWEHQAQTKCCPRCHSQTTAPFPEQVSAAVQYGSTIQAIAVYLSQVQLLPNERVCQVMKDLLGVTISCGSLHNWMARCAQAIEPIEEQIKTALRRAKVMHQDETGLYVAGTRQWMHVACTKTLTYFGVHEKRGREAMDAIGIVPHFRGISVHDGWASYQGYLCQHALCNVHHLRELTFLAEEHQQAWAAEMIDLLLHIKDAVHDAQSRGHSALSPPVRAEFEALYRAWLRQADLLNPQQPHTGPVKRGRKKQSVVRRLLTRLRDQQTWVLAFMTDFDVPFDNSLAERDIRMMKVQQKVSGCFRSQEGASVFCRIRSYVSTMTKQGYALLPLLEMALVDHPISPTF
ncbi:IS66 family transposase [Tengunoibacter tsumagoiensis]|uniref:Transposase n=1 Tax=Tengunoibacter tsumagoiensis TaxID=2014871 RepID=A0A401ZV16_9CHLR|nr:IS66 family transposase [Tengunoibacter tsumagoiensis]GCE10741.1 hypothetical protein KTT_06000 [Tengunoibacter tsumagoiensis]